MNTFHRRLTISFLLNLVRSVLVLMIVMAMVRLPEIDGSAMEAFSSFSSVMSAVLWFFDILLFVLPLSLLVATLFTVGFLARDHELTALRAAGWSMFQITWPVILIGVVAALVSGAQYLADLPRPFSMPSDAAGKTAFHPGLSYPLVNLLAVYLGIGLAASPRNKSRFVGFLRAGMWLMAYYIVSATANALGRHGGLPPLMAGWMATVFIAGIACVLWWKA